MQQDTTGKDPTTDPNGQRKALTFDPDAYRKYVAEADLTPDQEAELLETIWVIMVGFVDLGFNILPVQQVLGGENAKEALGEIPAPMLASDITNQSQQNDLSGARLGDAGERVDSWSETTSI